MSSNITAIQRVNAFVLIFVVVKQLRRKLSSFGPRDIDL